MAELLSTRQAIAYLESNGFDISYNRLLYLVRTKKGPAYTRVTTMCGIAYKFTKEDLDEFLATNTTRCLNCGNLVEKGKFCSKRCEQSFYAKKRKKNKKWFEECPFMNGDLKSHCDVHVLSADFCPLV